MFISVPDGGRHVYRYEIPADHRSGTFWYHPHMHGMVARQVAGGLAGVIVVEDALDQSPALAGATERLLVLGDPAVGSSSSVLDVSMMEQMRGREGDVVLVNGVVAPSIDARAGALEHWRVLNASPSRYYRLSLERHRFTVVATDGGRLAEPREASEVPLAPGERVEVLVAPSAAGAHRLRSLPYDRGTAGTGMGRTESSSARTLVATMKVVGAAPAAAIPTALAPAGSLDLPAPTSRRELVLAMGTGGGMGGGMGGGNGGGNGGGGRSFTIDGRSFDPSRTDISSELGQCRGLDAHQHLADGSPVPPPRLALPGRGAHGRRTDRTGLEGHRERARRASPSPYGYP